ncbi:PIG-L family deacetylase [Lacinutrix sp. C3R15]|uniref:PIG-L family deacetylase n=1 Tax=Flavobacteriaceae TaxID=49546 RepID=UPI001C09E29F|nr:MULTISPECIES: PIG-L family deacetylase [Flavobacteriaceae]MBU2940589.1 PIG-L family deacetylase [Lacinutrix sp. C3R15]MDO6623907.1 PIG-L family deacetylase [Oceanihabitans sp. 1_MG-2023]
MRKLLPFIFTLFFTFSNLQAQQPKKPNASQIFESLKKLNFLGSVLYVAAHPDDENTRLISYMSNKVKARTAYLSLTRGDGGQNLIGPEIRELLGVIRTQELLTARNIDGGEQRFTRANDFGYSKHPDETLAIWNKEEVLSDVVLAIRQFKPDVIINRFDHRSPGTTHGHHTSSAMLSLEAFDLANNKTAYPNQLKTTSLWQPKRAFFNASWWFYGSQEKFEKADKSKHLRFDIGEYYTSNGLSNTEIASLSRSQHKSQGFGNTGTRGSQMEYIELIKGEMPTDKTNIFEGIDTSWNRVVGGKEIGAILYQVEKDFDFTNPAASIPELLKAYQRIEKLEDLHWRKIKSEEIKNLIYNCAGLYLEAVAESNHATANESVHLNIELINRAAENIQLKALQINNEAAITEEKVLAKNVKTELKKTFTVTAKQEPTTPYWLTKKGTLGMYQVDDKSLIGKPETPRYFNVTFNLNINNIPIQYTKPIVYKTNDPVKGEVYKPFEIIPEASGIIAEKVIIFENDKQKEIPVIVKAGRDNLEGFVQLAHPKDWSVFPEKQKFSIANKGQEQTLVFTIIPPKNQNEGLITPMVHVGEKTYTKELIEIDYDHIPFQTVLLPSESKVVRLDIQKRGQNIAYIEGAGDVVPESLQQIGYHVLTIKPEDITAEALSKFDAVVVGIRAYNTVEELKFKQQILFDFVANGGNMIVQYNTNRRLKTENLAPYSLQLSRDRVTNENAKVTLLEPNHELLNFPNKITEKDFEGWTQERGLYFPDKWSKKFTPILSMHDKGESAKKGSLLVAKHGKGYYIYTGLSFFREFPAGVSGAYRLFANMLSIGKDNISTENTVKQ